VQPPRSQTKTTNMWSKNGRNRESGKAWWRWLTVCNESLAASFGRLKDCASKTSNMPTQMMTSTQMHFKAKKKGCFSMCG
jgi:hypothetical protein